MNGEVTVFDNFYTKYENATTFISFANAEAIRDQLESDIKAHKMSAEKYAYLSKTYVFLKNYKKSIEYAKKAVKLDKNYEYGYIRIAFGYAKEGNKKETLKYCKMAERLNQNNFFNKTFLIIFYNFCEDYEHAEELFRELIKENDNTAPYLYNIGLVYDAVKEDPVNAEYYYKLALDAGYKDKFNLYYNLADCYSEMQDIDNTEIFIAKCLEMYSNQDLMEKNADCISYRGRYKEAHDILKNLYYTTENKKWIVIN